MRTSTASTARPGIHPRSISKTTTRSTVARSPSDSTASIGPSPRVIGTRATDCFFGLADDPANRDVLKERLLFAGIMDLQDTLINRGGYQNIGHKALRARAL